MAIAIHILIALTIVAPTWRPADARTRAVITQQDAAASAAISPIYSMTYKLLI